MHKATGRSRHLVISITKIIDWSSRTRFSMKGTPQIAPVSCCQEWRESPGALNEHIFLSLTEARETMKPGAMTTTVAVRIRASAH